MPLRTHSYRLHAASLDQVRADLWIVQVPRMGWIMPVISASLCFFLGLLSLFISSSIWCAAIPVFMWGLYFACAYPLTAQARFNFTQREVAFTATYFLRFPRHITWCMPLNELTKMSQPWRRLGHSAIHLTFQNGTKLLMEFGQHQDGEHQLFRRIGVARHQGYAPQSQLESTG